MTLERTPITPSIPWFKLALAGIFLFCLILRFWRLGQFNTLVFDEVYYPVFASRYLLGEPVYNAHPPLSQLIIAIGMWLADYFPIGQDNINGLTGALRTTFSYRWLNALTGSFIPLVVAGIAYQLTKKKVYACLAALFMALDGLFLVESRYGLNNIYLVLFGLCGQYCFLLALETKPKLKGIQRQIRWFRDYDGGRFRWVRLISDRVSTFFITLGDSPPFQRWQKLTLAGIFFGLSAGIKWNGLAFLLGIYLLWLTAWSIKFYPLVSAPIGQIHKIFLSWLPIWSKKGKKTEKGGNETSLNRSLSRHNLLENLTQINLLQISGYLGILPVLTYSLTWVPHLLMNPKPGFWEMQQAILSFHQSIGSGPNVHPYCSPWYSWLVMWRPVAYFYQVARNTQEKIPTLPPLPNGTGKIVYDVHAMGNPFLWWLCAIVIIILFALVLQRLVTQTLWSPSLTPSSWLMLYFTLNYGANLLPWLKVTRCTFIYHYMGALTFAILALAWVVNDWLESGDRLNRQGALTIIIIISLAFIFWLPVYLGLPLSPLGYKIRMWLPNWV